MRGFNAGCWSGLPIARPKTGYVYSGRFIMPINASTSFSSEPRITQPNPNEYAAVSMACRASTASFCACVNR